MYACETWSITKGNKQKLLIFESNILSKIYGPILNSESENYERRKNEDIENIFNRPITQIHLKTKRLELADHVWWAKDKLIYRVLVNKPSGKKRREKPRQQ